MRTKPFIKIIFFLFIFGKLFSQQEDLNSSKYKFAKVTFEKSYSKQNFEKFSGKIIILNDHCIQFDEKTFTLYNVDNEYKLIFKNGIFYPNVITGNTYGAPKSKTELNRMNEEEKRLYNLTRIDSLHITNFNELSALNPSPKIKRFVFWLQNLEEMNPTECYFELENETANKDTSISDFIQNAKLTFYYKGTLIM